MADNSPETNFNPPWYLKGAMAQTLLNSAKFRNKGIGDFENNSREKIIDGGDGVNLQGFLSAHQDRTAPLLILFHGWEGSDKSAYMISTGRFFYDNGFSVFRLNMRDHGSSHGLNRGFFLGTLIDEAYTGVKEIIRRFSPDGSACLAGFSMGANFCIRVAKKASDGNYAGLKHIFAVNPPFDPLESTRRVDEIGLIRTYFLKKWKRSLAIKQRTFPEIYRFDSLLSLNGCIPMTERLLEEYTSFSSLEDYFGRYNLKQGYLDSVTVPLTLLTAEDDPIIPISHIASSEMSSQVRFIHHPRGGHCGYIMNRNWEAWYLEPMLRAFQSPGHHIPV